MAVFLFGLQTALQRLDIGFTMAFHRLTDGLQTACKEKEKRKRKQRKRKESTKEKRKKVKNKGKRIKKDTVFLKPFIPL